MPFVVFVCIVDAVEYVSWLLVSQADLLLVFATFQIADKKIIELEALRDLSKVWLHTDMDAFYAAVETLENPSLRGKPLAVGSLSMICTANYEVHIYFSWLLKQSILGLLYACNIYI